MGDNFDFFVLYDEEAVEDLNYAERILEFLEQNNKRGYASYRDSHPGQSMFRNFEVALRSSRYVFVLISNGAIRDKWWERQVETSLIDRMYTNTETVIPIYLPDLNIEDHPMVLSTFEGIHFSEDPQDHFWRKLLHIFSR